MWAAARAAQRGFTSVAHLRSALEATGIVAFLRDPASLKTDAATFDAHHRRWCRAIVENLRSKGIEQTTFGRAAKLVAIYLKSMVVTGPDHGSPLSAVVHPPIDRILLHNVARAASDAERAARWRSVAWTKLNEREYDRLVSELRTVLADGEPFWKLERCWTVG